MHLADRGQMSKSINLLLVEHLAVREVSRRHKLTNCGKVVSFGTSLLAGITHRSPRSFPAYKLVALGLINLLMTTSLWAGKLVAPAAPASLTATAISASAIQL